MQETDGKSTYVIYVDGKPVASASNAPARIDYRPQQDDLKKTTIRPGSASALPSTATAMVRFRKMEVLLFREGDGRESNLLCIVGCNTLGGHQVYLFSFLT